MAYATQDDLCPLRISTKDLTELTDDTFTGSINTNIVNDALSKASGLIDSYCRARYQTPLAADENIVDLACDIAIYILFKRRRQNKISETVQSAYDAAIAFMKDVAAARASLDQPLGASPQTSVSGPEHSCADRELRFREENIKGFV